MKKVQTILLLTLALFVFEVRCSETDIFPASWFVENIHSIDKTLIIALRDGRKKDTKYFKMNLSTYETNQLGENDFKKELSNNKSEDKIKYTLNKCLSIDEIYLSYDSICESATFFVNGNKYELFKDKFYKWHKFLDPVLWGDILVFKNFYPLNKSGDTNKFKKASISGVITIDLKEKRLRPELENLRGAFITSMLVDQENSILWIGSGFGLYGYNKDLKETVSCVIKQDKKGILNGLICGVADYIYDYKREQFELLIKKDEAFKRGKEAPRDSGKKIDEAHKRVVEEMRLEKIK